jgi:hypothetical protein
MNGKILQNGKLRALWDGFASVFDISGQSFITIPDFDSGFQKDCEAIKGDWENIGNDFRRAMDIIAHEQ